MAQYGLPTSDTSKGSTPPSQCAGDSNANAWEELDEGFGAGRGSGSGPDDATTAWWFAGAGNEAACHIECGLSSVTDPVSSTAHSFSVRVRKTNTGACGTTILAGQQVDIVQVLKQGATTKATLTTVNFDAAYTTLTYTLSSAEADSITNYGDLRIRCYYNEVGGGAGRSADLSAMEFTCPDATSGTPLTFTGSSALGSYADTNDVRRNVNVSLSDNLNA